MPTPTDNNYQNQDQDANAAVENAGTEATDDNAKESAAEE